MDPTPPPIARLNSASSSHRRQASRNISGGSSVGSSGIQGHRPRPSRDDSNGMRGQPTAATSDMVVPNKSRMREEEIEVPYARDSMIMDEPRAQSRSSNRPGSRTSFQDRETPLGSRQDSGDVMSPASADDREYYDRMSFSSNVTNKSKLPTGPGGWEDEKEQKIRSEYELKIAGLERRIQAAERDRDEARRQEAFEAERRREMEDEIRGLKEVSTVDGDRLTSSGQRHTHLRFAHCSMNWILPETLLKLLEHTASRIQGAQRKKWSTGDTDVNHSRMSYAVWNRTSLAVKE
jgi:hypothetical protein